ncbi:hypothetical protein T03_13425 [Trichinella britovi]|uniref:Uncharacterized protein n=1 Tax=Trichinella britovi TaxID=45882 RepID=A0A0V1CS29_TRIBR|nr:hypothetical protein T03_13425 [Trichinella britovi]
MQWISARPVDASLSLDQNLASQSNIRGGPSMDESSIAEARWAEKCISPFNEDEISFTPVFTAPVSPFPTLPAPPAHFRPTEPEAVQHGNMIQRDKQSRKATDPRQMWEAKMAPASNSAAALVFAKQYKRVVNCLNFQALSYGGS